MLFGTKEEIESKLRTARATLRRDGTAHAAGFRRHRRRGDRSDRRGQPERRAASTLRKGGEVRRESGSRGSGSVEGPYSSKLPAYRVETLQRSASEKVKGEREGKGTHIAQIRFSSAILRSRRFCPRLRPNALVFLVVVSVRYCMVPAQFCRRRRRPRKFSDRRESSLRAHSPCVLFSYANSDSSPSSTTVLYSGRDVSKHAHVRPVRCDTAQHDSELFPLLSPILPLSLVSPLMPLPFK